MLRDHAVLPYWHTPSIDPTFFINVDSARSFLPKVWPQVWLHERNNKILHGERRRWTTRSQIPAWARDLSTAFSLLSTLLFVSSSITLLGHGLLAYHRSYLIYCYARTYLRCLLLLNVALFNYHCNFLPTDLPVNDSFYCERERKSQKVTDIYGISWTMRTCEPNKLSSYERPFWPSIRWCDPNLPSLYSVLLLPVTFMWLDLLTPGTRFHGTHRKGRGRTFSELRSWLFCIMYSEKSSLHFRSQCRQRICFALCVFLVLHTRLCH